MPEDQDTPDVKQASENTKGRSKHDLAEKKTEHSSSSSSSHRQKEGDDDFEDMLSGLTSLSLGKGSKKPAKKEESQEDDQSKALRTTAGKSHPDEREERRKNVLVDDEEALREGEWCALPTSPPCLYVIF